MRDADRITPFLQEFEALWKQHPDLRFGQLVSNLQCRIDGKNDPFYTEDSAMLKAIRHFNEE